MRVFAAAIVSSLLPLAAAQTTIQVGGDLTSPGGIFQFIPAQTNVTKGTVVTFVFMNGPGNHSVTQSTFNDPCDPMENGFDSGWVFIPSQDALQNAEPPTFNVTITDDTEPIWFFCKQLEPAPHCDSGMVGAINAPESGPQSFKAFFQKAVSFPGIPGQGQGGLVGSGASAAGLPAPISTQRNISLVLGTPLEGPASTTGSLAGIGTASATVTSTLSLRTSATVNITASATSAGTVMLRTSAGVTPPIFGNTTSGSSASQASTAPSSTSSSSASNAIAISGSMFSIMWAAMVGYYSIA